MKRKILIVDDELGIRNLFAEILGDVGHDVILAESGQEALNILQEETIEVIFLDLRLFGMNGIELCRKIRRINPLAVIYAVTGFAALFEIEECREAGFDDYFTKPVPQEILIRAVEEAFEKLERWKKRYPTLPRA